MTTTRRESERLDPVAIEQHDRLSVRIWMSSFFGLVGLGVVLWAWYLSSIGAITTENDWWVWMMLVGWLVAIFCGVSIFMFALMISRLPDVRISRSRETVFQSETQPRPPLIIKHITGNTMRIVRLNWDLSDGEAEQFAMAVGNHDSITRDMIKKHTDIVNINDRYAGWVNALEEVGAVERVGRRVMVTDHDIIAQYLPPNPYGDLT